MKLLVKNADVLVTMDGARRELKGGCLLVENGVITSVGPEVAADEILDATGCVVTPGLVNTHHHLYQSLTRVVPGGQDALLFGWLQTLYPIWAKMRPKHMKISAQVGLAELALSGCTMSSDHLYLYPNGVRLEDTIEAAQSLGMRFHPTRGSMRIGESDGGLPPDSLVEREADILEDSIRLIDGWHDASEGSMLRIGLAPCSPFSVSRELMRDSALLARDKGVMLHTHLAENDEDIAYSLAKFGCRPGEYVQELGWVGEDVWHAHCVKLDVREIDLFAATGTGVAHCPCSNCRLGSGIAPVRAMRDAGVKVGLGVDGSASNDAGDIISEARQMLLLQRVQNGANAFSAREALEVATLGGAQVLGRPDCGSLEVGKRADFAVWDAKTLANAGAWDPVAALVLCGPQRVRDLYVEGRAVVREGQITRLDMPVIAEQARALAAGLA
ncbi:MAG: 8-oxoguanine deaminase [Rhodobacteraceae bacterium]|nr:8-oxoguanine deaminase [Paracoccaceae bacterium]